jgi:hypothetical protein
LEALEGRILPSVYAVINTADSGEGSLRQALLDANAHPGPDTIIFDIPGAGVHTIRPTSPLPAITDPLVLDATFQPGYAGSPLIELSGADAGANASGLTITGGGSTVRGLVIDAFSTGTGIVLQGNGGNSIVGNWIGTDATGTAPLPNRDGVVLVSSSNNAVGGTEAGDGNTIAGNSSYGVVIGGGGNVVQGSQIGTDVTGTRALGNGTGVYITGSNNAVGGTAPGAGNTISGNGAFGVISAGDGNLIQGNLIGTDVTGTRALGNGTGVYINWTNNTVGGTAAGAGNTISGNSGDGVTIGIVGNVVKGNRIGTDVTGTRALGNRTGVSIVGSNNTVVGGAEAGDGNTISGNTFAGVSIVGGIGDVVQGNRIGTDATGTAPLPNFTGVSIGNSNNIAVGGTAAGAGNTIAFNQGDGVLVSGGFLDLGTSNAILRNAIFGNGRLGIELTSGGNHNQPPPTLTSATSAGGVLTVQGTLQGRPVTTYTVELFANSAGGPAQGERFLASLTVTTGADGSASFTLSLALAVDPGDSVTATATDPGNNTSPFSNAALVTGPTLVAVAEAGPGGAPVAGAAGAGLVAPTSEAAPAAPPALGPPAQAAQAPAPAGASSPDAGPCPPWLGLDLVFEALGRWI